MADVVQQWYKRRKANVDCYVGEKFKDPVEYEEDCQCTAEDYEWCVCIGVFVSFPRTHCQCSLILQ